MPRARGPKVPPALHELEAEVMAEVWRQGETTVKAVMEGLNRSARAPRAYTTYMTVMQRLDEKELLSRTRRGRSDTYVPRLSEEEYNERRARAQVAGLVKDYGDVALAHFARELSDLDPARLRALSKLARDER